MPSELVRLTLDKESNKLIVEYGARHQPGLEEAEWEEKQALEQELMEYQDFTTAENLDDEKRQKLMEKKQRYEKLQAKEKEMHVIWVPVEAKLIESVLLIYEPETLPVYIENLPSQMLKKLMEPQLTLNLGPLEKGILGAPSFPTGPNKIMGQTRMRKVLDVLNTVSATWADWIDVTEEGGTVYVRPRKFGKENWPPINEALKAAFGKDIWKSKGKGDRQAHWEIRID